MQTETHRPPGALALAGSGEYTPAMETTDRLLLDTLGGPAAARVLVIPTASALEPGMPQHWADMGVRHFHALGAHVEPAMILTRDDALRPPIIAAVRAANFYYFSGGDPQHLIETLRDTPTWDAILANHRAGAVIAGCSAGAMMLGGHTLDVRNLQRGQPPRWPPALGLLPNIALIPHFDRAATFVGEELFRVILAAAPPGTALIGLDEDTALVRTSNGHSAPTWQALGRQTIVVFTGRNATTYRAGETVDLPPP